MKRRGSSKYRKENANKKLANSNTEIGFLKEATEEVITLNFEANNKKKKIAPRVLQPIESIPQGKMQGNYAKFVLDQIENKEQNRDRLVLMR